MMCILFGILFWLVPAVFSTANNSETAEEVGTFFVGRIIFTKWCGPGNDSINYDDLGENREIDICCRDHDHCKLFVESGETNYGYRNDGLYTISDCKCDSQLRECLERLDFLVANSVLRIFAFTNQKCLINYCQLPYIRCPRDEIRYTAQKYIFEGIEMANDTEALNKLIRDGMKNDQKTTTSESIKNQRSNQNHPVLSQSYQQPYPVYYPWSPQPIDYLAAPESGNFPYHNLPITPILQSDIVCCVDELQHL